MKRILSGLIILASLSLSFAQETAPPVSPTMRIGSYNIQIFGKAEVDRPNTLTVLAEIATTFDVLAIEEVGSNGSSASDATCTAVMSTYVARLNQVIGSDANTFFANREQALS